MRASEINTYDDLIKYLKLEISKQTQIKRVVSIELPRDVFFKMVKFIQFFLRNDSKERWANVQLAEDTKKFEVRINGFLTKVETK